MNSDEKKAKRAEYTRNYMRNYRSKIREKETAEMEAYRTRLLRQFRQLEETESQKLIRREVEAQRIRAMRQKQNAQRKTEENLGVKLNSHCTFTNKNQKIISKELTKPIVKNELSIIPITNTLEEDKMYCSSNKSLPRVLKVKSLPPLKNKMDHFSIFGDYVASRLRILNNPQLQTIGQQRINTILFHLEMSASLNGELEFECVSSASDCSISPKPKLTINNDSNVSSSNYTSTINNQTEIISMNIKQENINDLHE